MSFNSTYRLWVTTSKEIKDLIKRQNVLKTLEPIEDNRFTFKILSELYVLYMDLVNKLGQLFHYTYQVQKREIIRPLVDAAVNRLLELKNELKNLQLNEFVYIDNVLMERRLTPYDIQIWRSPHFLYRRTPDIENILHENQLFMNDEEREQCEVIAKQKITDAIILIQAHERARQMRIYLSKIKYDKKFLKVRSSKMVTYTYTYDPDHPLGISLARTVYAADYVKPSAKCDIREESHETIQPRYGPEEAAIILQKYWRMHKAIKVAKQMRAYKYEFLGMRLSRPIYNPENHTHAILEMYRKEIFKQELDADFVKLMENERIRLLQQRTPWIMEDISDQIRDWFREFYDKLGDFHPYPEALKGGTILVITDVTMSPMEYKEYSNYQSLSKDEKKKRAEKEKMQKIKDKEKLKKEKMKEIKRRKKLKAAGIYDIAYEFSQNPHMKKIEKTMERYSIEWRAVDEYLNKHEPIKEWVTENELAKIHQELRLLVDEYMRVEYELLRKALAADQKRKYKRPKAKKEKPAANKKTKKTKKTTDTADDLPIETVYQNLLNAGIVTKYHTKFLDNYIAEVNFHADDNRDENNFTLLPPHHGDIKVPIQETIMGMGEIQANKPKSICIIGPQNSGKKLLVKIIACELDALLLDLSPEKTFVYADNLNEFINDVLRLARAFQPTILYIDNAHRVFWKKVPHEEQKLKPQLLQPILMKKIIKPLKKTDRIMILGTSDAPWTANAKFKKAFQKFLPIPKANYGTTFLAWMKLMLKYLNVDQCTDYILSTLARVFKMYATGEINNSLTDTNDIQLRKELLKNPIDPKAFANYFLNKVPPTLPLEDKILDKYQQWYEKTDKLAKMKAAYVKKLQAKSSKKK